MIDLPRKCSAHGIGKPGRPPVNCLDCKAAREAADAAKASSPRKPRKPKPEQLQLPQPAQDRNDMLDVVGFDEVASPPAPTPEYLRLAAPAGAPQEPPPTPPPAQVRPTQAQPARAPQTTWQALLGQVPAAGNVVSYSFPLLSMRQRGYDLRSPFSGPEQAALTKAWADARKELGVQYLGMERESAVQIQVLMGMRYPEVAAVG